MTHASCLCTSTQAPHLLWRGLAYGDSERARSPWGRGSRTAASMTALVLAIAAIVAPVAPGCTGTPPVTDGPGVPRGPAGGPGHSADGGNEPPSVLWEAARNGWVEVLDEASLASLAAVPPWVRARVAQPTANRIPWAVARAVSERWLAAEDGAGEAVWWLSWPLDATDAEQRSHQVHYARALLAAGELADAVAVCEFRPGPLDQATLTALEEIRRRAIAAARVAPAE